MLRQNIIANFAGNAWIVLLSLASVPLYVHFLGVEAYGLVGFFSTLLSVFAILDMGLGAALTRAMAQLQPGLDNAADARNLLRTLELVYWLIGLVGGAAIFFAAPLISIHWLNLNVISTEDAVACIRLMGVTLALRWPLPLYFAGLMGLERQVLVSVIKIIFETFRIVGAILLLWLFSATIQSFFLWQIISVSVFVPLTAFILWNALPKSVLAVRVDFNQLRKIRKFAAGMAGITIASAVLMQLDKVVLSGILSLENFGYYALASSAALALFQLVGPVSNAIFPRLSRVAAAVNSLEKESELKSLYHRACQLISFLIFPAGFLAIFFSYELLQLWTHNISLAERTAPILAILVAGNLLNGLMLVPYAVQLAHGWVGLSLNINMVSVILLPPLLVIGAVNWGGEGAATAWLALNAGYVFIGIPLMHRKLLVGEKWRWYFEDIMPTLISVLSIALIAVCFRPTTHSAIDLVEFLMITYFMMLATSALATKVVRSWIFSKFF